MIFYNINYVLLIVFHSNSFYWWPQMFHKGSVPIPSINPARLWRGISYPPRYLFVYCFWPLNLLLFLVAGVKGLWERVVVWSQCRVSLRSRFMLANRVLACDALPHSWCMYFVTKTNTAFSAILTYFLFCVVNFNRKYFQWGDFWRRIRPL